MELYFDVNNQDQASNRLFVQLLKENQLIIASCLRGRSQFVSAKENSENLIVTNTSKHLLEWMYRRNFSPSSSLSSWKCQFIKSVIEKSHINHFYDSGLFLMHLTNEILLCHELDNKNLVDKITTSLINIVNSNTPLLTLKPNLDSTSFLRTLLNSVLNRKMVFNRLNEAKKQAFVNTCLKCFITSFNESHFSDIIYLFNEDLSMDIDRSFVCDGLLIKTDSPILLFDPPPSSYRCVVFSSNSLSGDFELLASADNIFDVEKAKELNISRTQIDYLTKKLDHLITKFQVNLVLSQKVIHPSIISHLLVKKVVVIDRLSEIYISNVCKLAGCQAIDSPYNMETELFNNYLGRIRKLSQIDLLSKSYIHLEADQAIQTMVICIPNQNLTSDIEHVIRVAQHSFQRTIINCKALIGGPCFYSYIMGQFNHGNLKEEHALISIFTKYLKTILYKPLNQYRVSQHTGHLFRLQSEYCECKLLKIKQVQERHIDFAALTQTYKITANEWEKYFLRNEESVTLISCFESKINAIKVMRDILLSILSLGIYIHE